MVERVPFSTKVPGDTALFIEQRLCSAICQHLNFLAHRGVLPYHILKMAINYPKQHPVITPNQPIQSIQNDMNNSEQPEISIWDAKNRLAYNEPLQPGDALFVDTGKARGDYSLKRLYRELNVDNQGIAHAPPRKQYLLFTGHRGCGKSTELLRVADYLHDPDRYYVVHLDCLEKLDINNLKYSDVLLALAAALLRKLKDEDQIRMEQVHLTNLEDWFRKKVETHTRLKEFSAEIKAGIKGEGGLPWLVNLYAELTSKIGIGSSYREELRLVIRNGFTEFADSFNRLIRASEDKIRNIGLGKRILFTVDGTDRLDSEDARQFFVDDVHQLTQINGLFIYCAPIHLLHEDNQLNASFGQPFRLPMLKIRGRDNQPIPENYQVMRDLALRRIPAYLFDDLTTLDYLIQYSGGHPRDLLRLLNVAINFAEEEQIDRAAAAKSVKQVANEYRRFINSTEYARLVEIDQNPDMPDDFTDEESSKMLYNLILLEYNDYFWKSHPLIETLPGYIKAAQEAGAAMTVQP